MDQFDRELMERAKREPCPIPEDYAGRVFAACAALEETVTATRSPRRRHWPVWAAAMLALFIAVPNASPTAAAALAEVPVLGAIVRVVTFRNYNYDDGWHSADVSVAELEGGEGAQAVNDRVRAYTDRLLKRFQTLCESMGGSYGSLDVTSTVVTDSDAWFTLRVDAVEIQASGYAFSRFYHIDKATDQVVTLRDLFREDADYVAALSGEVRRQRVERMEQDADVLYFPEEFTVIDPEQNFYFDEAGALVLVFDEYTIAPGSMGMPEFTIPAEVYEPLLK